MKKSNQNFQNIFAIDCSGSTSGCNHYHQNVRTIYNDFYKEGDLILLWDTNIRLYTQQKFEKVNNNRKGFGGTSPQVVAEYLTKIENHQNIHLILITDGQVSGHDVDFCTNIMIENNIQLGKATVYIIGPHESANLSVSCSFTRNCESNVYQIDPNSENKAPEIQIQLSKEDIESLNKISLINTQEEFEEIYQSLEKALVARFVGTSGDIQIKNELLLMQKRLIFSKSKTEFIKSDTEIIIDLVRSGKIEESLEFASKFFKTKEEVIKSEFEKNISHLINIASGSLKQKFSMKDIKSSRFNIANDVENVDTLDIEESNSLLQQTFQCPVTWEDSDDPAILISKPKLPLITSLNDKKSTEMMFDSPLNAFHSNKLIKKIIFNVDHVVSLKTLHQAFQSGNKIYKSPITRKTILGAIPLGPQDSHVDAANWTLMNLITGAKKLGQVDFWFAVLWLLVLRNKIPYLFEYEPFLREQLIYRFRKHKSSASLSGNSSSLQLRLPLDICCWFCISTPFMIPRPLPSQDMFLVHLIHSKELVDILKSLNIKFHPFIDTYIKRFTIAQKLLKFSKKYKTNYKFIFNSFIQRSIHLNIPKNSKLKFDFSEIFIPIDGAPLENDLNFIKNLLPKTIQSVSFNELYYISQFINPNIHLGSVNIPFDNEIPIFKPIIEWDYINKIENFDPIKICENTARPFYQSLNGNWFDLFKQKYNPPENAPFLSMNQKFSNFIINYHEYPTFDEFLLYLFKNYILNGKYLTLPSNIILYIQSIMKDYEIIIEKIDPKEFSTRFLSSVKIEDRIVLESQ